MRLLWVLLVCSFSVVCFAEEPIAVEADHATYEGGTLYLKGAVHLVHDLGTIEAEEVSIESAENGKINQLGSVKMERQVCFAMRGGGEFNCAKAVLLRKEMCGRFYGNDDGIGVSFVEMVKGKRNMLVPLTVKSRMMEMQIGCVESCRYIDKIVAIDDVAVDYNQTFTLTSAIATYSRVPKLEGESSIVKTLPGTILLEPSPGEHCHATNIQGDAIKASKIVIDSNKREMHFNQPKGTISTLSDKIPVLFSSNLLIWDLSNKLLKLTGSVTVEQAPVGLCKSNKAMHISYVESKGKNELRTIESFGKTYLHHYGIEKRGDQHLSCGGRAFIDHEHLVAILECAHDGSGNVVPGSEVHFRDAMAELKGQKITITYALVNGKMVAVKALAEGDVSLLGAKRDKGRCYYALADCVEYFPDKQEVVCSSSQSGRVLFYDKINSLRISAPGVIVKREAKKESIQGIGDVRLSFADTELSEFKKHFNMDK